MIYKNNSETIELDVADDGSVAYITIKETGKPINENDIIELLNEASIIYGLTEAAQHITETNLEKKFNEPFPIAISDKTLEPQVEFSFMLKKDNCIRVNDFNNDFNSLDKLEKVLSDQPLAHLFITKKGRAGKNIFGSSIIPENNDDSLIEAFLGEGVYYSSERSQILAETSGYPYLDENNKVNVKNTFIVDGDIDLSFNNFKLLGNLIVNGTIKDKINADIEGNLIVNGDINDAGLNVKGNIKVNGDILNCRKNFIFSKGNIEYESAENARIVSAKKIIFKNHSHFCRLVAEDGIYGNEETSSIVGGLAQSGKHIEVAIIGNSSSIGTEVEITISPYNKEIMLSHTKKIILLKEQPNPDLEEIKKIEQELQNLQIKIEEAINETLFSEDSVPKHIIAYKKIFGGCYLRILKKSKTIFEEMEKLSFSIQDGELIYDQY